jgi:putative mRNA 3-end processing factor
MSFLCQIFLNNNPPDCSLIVRKQDNMPLLHFTEKGIYCAEADVYIDPWKPVGKALITHGHADHSRWGHQKYLAHAEAAPVIRHRLGDIRLQTVDYGQKIVINGVKFSFHPAGHIPGSSQIRVEHKGEVWVASGDYKLEDDGLSQPFEPVKCHTFITESTFGLPVFRWQHQQEVFDEIKSWWMKNKNEGKTSVLIAYALGKAQRLIKGLEDAEGKIFTHGAVENINNVLRGQGVKLPETILPTADIPKSDYVGSLVVAPPSALATPWLRKFQPFSTAMASGWMALRGTRRRRAVDRGFILSDHADWYGLNKAVEATGAQTVIVTHGYTDIFSQWLNEKGLRALTEKTEFEGETLLGEDN